MWNSIVRQAVRSGSRRSLRVAAMAAASPSTSAVTARTAVPASFVSVRTFAKKRSKTAPSAGPNVKSAAESAATTTLGGDGGDGDDAAGFQTIVDKAKRNMEGGVLQFERALGQMRPGKADANVLDEVRVAAYGQHVALSQLAQVAVAGPYALSITIFDPALVPDIKQAIVDTFPVFGMREDASTLHISIPKMSRETREELLKAAKKLAETSRQHVRRARQDATASVKKLKTQVSEDDVKKELEHIQDLTDDAIARIGKLLTAKETELKEGM